jgi:ABC-type transport system involved in multi-copper enzyme maturation permease subunit
MKGFWKLTKGEALKLWKSKAIVVMAIVMALLIGGMSAAYAFFEPDGVRKDLVLRFETRVDAFDRLHEEFGADSNAKLAAMNVSPAVFNALADPDSLDARYGLSISAHVHTVLDRTPEIAERTDIFAKFSAVQARVRNEHEIQAESDRQTMRRLEEQLSFFANAENNHCITDFVLTKFNSLETEFLELRSVYATFWEEWNDFFGDKNSPNNPVAAAFNNLTDAFDSFQAAAGDVVYYVNTPDHRLNYLLFERGSAEFKLLERAVEPFNSELLGALRNMEREIQSELEERSAVSAFFREYSTRISDVSAGAEITALANFGERNRHNFDSPLYQSFLYGLESLLSDSNGGLTGEESLLFFHNGFVADLAEQVLNEDYPLMTAETKRLVESYLRLFPLLSETAEKDTMRQFVGALDQSMWEIISDSGTKEKLNSFHTEINSLTELRHYLFNTLAMMNPERQLFLVLSVVPDAFTIVAEYPGEYVPRIFNNNADYIEMSAGMKSLHQRLSALESVLISTYTMHVINRRNLSDSDISSLRGFEGTHGFPAVNKYALRSYIARTTHLLENNLTGETFKSIDSMDGGGGYMNFVYALTAVLVVFFGVFMGAGAIAGEKETMKLVLTRPHSRAQILSAKLLTILTVLLAFTILNYVVTVLAALAWGFDGVLVLTVVNSQSVMVMSPAVVMLLSHLLGFLQAAVYAIFALMLGTLTKNKGLSVCIALFVFAMPFVLGALLSGFVWYGFLPFSAANLWQFFGAPASLALNTSFGLSVAALAVYLTAMIVATYLAFIKRDA